MLKAWRYRGRVGYVGIVVCRTWSKLATRARIGEKQDDVYQRCLPVFRLPSGPHSNCTRSRPTPILSMQPGETGVVEQ